MKIVEYAGDKEDFVLAKIIRTSFDADTACHLGADKRDSPSGYHNGELLKQSEARSRSQSLPAARKWHYWFDCGKSSKHQICYFLSRP